MKTVTVKTDRLNGKLVVFGEVNRWGSGRTLNICTDPEKKGYETIDDRGAKFDLLIQVKRSENKRKWSPVKGWLDLPPNAPKHVLTIEHWHSETGATHHLPRAVIAAISDQILPMFDDPKIWAQAWRAHLVERIKYTEDLIRRDRKQVAEKEKLVVSAKKVLKTGDLDDIERMVRTI